MYVDNLPESGTSLKQQSAAEEEEQEAGGTRAQHPGSADQRLQAIVQPGVAAACLQRVHIHKLLAVATAIVLQSGISSNFTPSALRCMYEQEGTCAVE